MANVGRNEPCPCGSSKKFKHCHLRVDEAAQSDSHRAMRMHDLDRQLVERLLPFAVREFGEGWIDELLDLLDIDALDEPLTQLVVPCALYEWTSDEGTLLERFLASPANRLDAREKGWLEAQRRSWLSIWEVESVTPGIAVTIRDVFTGEERRVLEQSGSRTLLPRDAILARVVDFEGLTVFCGMHPRALPPRPAAAVFGLLRKELRTRAKVVPIERLRQGIPLEGWLLAWGAAVEHDDLARTKLPKLQNTDGDPLLLTKDRYHFDASDRPRLEAKLAALAEPEEDYAGYTGEHVFVVQRPGNAIHKTWDNTIVGRIVVRAREFVVETNSIRRADDLRAKVEAQLASMVRHRARDHEDPTAALLAGGMGPAARSEKATPPPELLEALRDMKRRHYEGWLDTPLPALAGITPREAVHKRRERDELVLMLKEIENCESRAPADERVDVSTLWTELGLRAAAP